MARVHLSLGSNRQRHKNITSCLDALATEFGDLALSSVYESESVGFDGSPFYNLVAVIETSKTVGELSRCLKAIEDAHGRNRQAPKFSSRTLDIDILTYDDRVGEIEGVDLPRDEITKNAFVLLPLAELAGAELHPSLQQSYADLWQQYSKAQKLWAIDFGWQGQSISKASQ